MTKFSTWLEKQKRIARDRAGLPRIYKPLTELDVLNACRAGVFLVDVDGGKVFRRRRNGVLKAVTRDICWRGYHHVRIHYRGGRRSIALHKLVWMVANNQLVPEGHEIHHRGKKYQNGIRFLELKDKVGHYITHHGNDDDWYNS